MPFWLAYDVLYGSPSDSRWHDCGHGTAFRTPWMNNAVYELRRALPAGAKPYREDFHKAAPGAEALPAD